MAQGTNSAPATTTAAAKPEVAAPGATGTAAQEPESAAARRLRSQGIVRRNVYWALGVGIIPFPVIDFMSLIAIELKMIKELADAYGVKFTEATAKSIVSSLAVSIGTVGIAGVVVSSLMKLVPAIGTVAGMVSTSVVAGAFTLAVGNVFIMHFETGGTLLSFNIDKMRAHFLAEFEKAKVNVAQIQKDEQAKVQARPTP